ncbi:hypothetical protein [Pseudooceanicola aestuarii]|uniref:hypothetical protein n=1 Tax=Pseudooceanicola aestuarii TaxID=2697319 RepID=UPI0013D4D136|nr:hypothetical protein [Pseudooceanicola aestuarii]
MSEATDQLSGRSQHSPLGDENLHPTSTPSKLSITQTLDAGDREPAAGRSDNERDMEQEEGKRVAAH